MIRFGLNSQTLGNMRFSISPIAEASLSIRLLNVADPRWHPHAPWFRATVPRLDSVDMELLLSVMCAGRWLPSCLISPSHTVAATIEDQLQDLATLTHERVLEDLRDVWAEHPPPARVRRVLEDRHGPEVIAETLSAYWDVAIAPYWSRMRAVLDDDIALRVGSLFDGRMYDMLDGIHPEVSIDGDWMLIDKPAHADQDCQAAQMTLEPAIFAWPQLIVDLSQDGEFILTYAASGAARAWALDGEQDRGGSVEEALAALLGRGRSAVLGATATPQSTTQIARGLGKSLATVSEHLSVLRSSGLVSQQRLGRNVLYWQTPLAESLVSSVRLS